MCGFLIADDMASVVVLLGADESDFQHWQQHRIAQQQQNVATADATSASQLPSQLLSAGKDCPTAQAEGVTADRHAAATRQAEQQQQQQQQHSSAVSWGWLKGHIIRPAASVGSSGDLRHSSSIASLDRRRSPKRKGAGMLLAQQRQLSSREVSV
jgi:hypothetical protein